MSGEKTKATLSWELNTIKVAAKEMLDKADALIDALDCNPDISTCTHGKQRVEVEEATAKLRALVDGAAKEGAA